MCTTAISLLSSFYGRRPSFQHRSSKWQTPLLHCARRTWLCLQPHQQQNVPHECHVCAWLTQRRGHLAWINGHHCSEQSVQGIWCHLPEVRDQGQEDLHWGQSYTASQEHWETKVQQWQTDHLRSYSIWRIPISISACRPSGCGS